MFSTPHTAIQIFNAAPDAVIVIDEKGTILNWNPMAEKMFGWSREEAIGKLLAETIIPDRYRTAHQEGLKKYLETGTGKVINSTVEVHARDIKGEEFEISLRISKSELNDRVFFIGFIRDISDQKRAEQTTQYNSTLLQHVSDAVFSTDKDMIIKSWNESAEKMYGYSAAEIIGKNISTLRLNLTEEDINKHKKSLRQQGYYKDEYKVRSKNGDEITILASVNVIKSSGKVTGYIAVQRDITLRKKMEAQLRIFNKELSRLVEVKTAEIKQSYEAIRELVFYLQDIREEERLKIAQEIHDELGQQLTIMKMDVSWLDKKLPVDDLQIKEKTQALKNTLDATVKTVRRIASELRPSVLDDMGLAVAIEWHSREIEKRTGIRINLNINMDQSDLNDTTKINLFRVIQESLTNVVRYAKAKIVDISAVIKNNEIWLSIHDDGIGFDQNEIALKKTLGILGMKERIASLGGRFSLESRPGDGTVINVSVPLPV